MPEAAAPALSLVADESAFLVEARSTVGAIRFGTTTIGGHLHAAVTAGAVDLAVAPRVELTLPVAALTSGNAVYDAEVRERLNARRYPAITAALRQADPIGDGRFQVVGDLTIRGETRSQSATVEISVSEPPNEYGGTVVVAVGSMQIDIRDFAIDIPKVLMFRIFPDVTVSFRITAVVDSAPEGG